MSPRRPGSVTWWRSLRVRIALAVATVSLLVSGAVGYALAQQAATSATDSLRAQALARLDTVVDGYLIDGRLRQEASLDPTFPPAAMSRALDEEGRASYFDGQWMWASQRISPTILLTVRLDAADLARQNATRLTTMGWAALLAVAGSLLLGWLVAGPVSARLRRASSEVAEIGAGSELKVHHGGADEVAALTRAIDAMAEALSHRLQQEQAFTADVAHELRTPVTALVSASELLADGPEATLVRNQVARLRRLVEDLLEISRLDGAGQPADLDTVDLGDALRNALAASELADSVSLTVTSSEPVLVDGRRLGRVVANLLVNLGRHGGGQGELEVDGHEFTLRDHGPGYPDDVLAAGPRPFHAVGRSKGSGLGLTIAEKQLASMGGTLTLGNHPDGGALTRVRLVRPAD